MGRAMKALTAHGVTLTIERDANEGRPRFQIAAGNYRGTIPECGCERPVCAGRCSVPSNAKVAIRDKHNTEVCHGSMKYGMHTEHVELFAGKVLKTFAPEARKPWAPGTITLPGLMGEIPADIQAQLDIALAERKAQGLKPDAAPKVPNVGAARGPLSGYAEWLPLDGEEVITALHATDGKWVVRCNAIRCRDERGYVTRISEWGSSRLADGAVERHKAWHAEQRTGVASPVRQGLMLKADEMREGDWYHNADGWQRIALIVPLSNQVRIHDETSRTGLGLIATLGHKHEYLIVRADARPVWTPVYDARKGGWVEP